MYCYISGYNYKLRRVTTRGRKLPANYSGSKKTFIQDTIKDNFIQRILGPEVLSQNHKKSVLYLDNATCHTTVGVKSKLEEFNIQLQMVPARMTGLVQPADVGWFKSIKAGYYRSWTDWYCNNDHAFTAAGNLKSPGYVNVITAY